MIHFSLILLREIYSDKEATVVTAVVLGREEQIVAKPKKTVTLKAYKLLQNHN